jgi:hypothetical protein
MTFFQHSEFRIQNFFFLILLAAPIASAQKWTLVDGNFQSRSVTISAMDRQGAHVDGGKVEPWDQILELDHAGVSQSNSTQPFDLRLNGGDSLAGAPVAIAGDMIVWQHPLLGQLQIPEDRASAIVRAGTAIAAITEARRQDTVNLINGDSTSGVVQGLADARVSITPAGVDVTAQIGLDKIAAILLADPDPSSPPAPGPDGAWRIWLSDGSSLTVPRLTMAADQPGRLQIGFGDKTAATIDASAVSCIERLNGPVRWLTELSPTEVVYHPFLDEDFPPRFDHPVDDPAVSIREKFPPFRHGIGVHSYTKLTYAVPDGFSAFRTQFAIERIAGSDETRADLAVRISVDGKVVQQFPHVRFGPAADPITVDVHGAREISLEVDYGDNLAAQGRFLWLDPAFVKFSTTP